MSLALKAWFQAIFLTCPHPLEQPPEPAGAEFIGPDRGRTHNAARRRASQPANATVVAQSASPPPDSVLKPVRGVSRQNREAMRPKKTILCVDDNEQILSVRTFLLETRGYRVIALTSPHDALATIANLLPGSIDLLLCDLLMPEMEGNELVRRAKQLQPSLPAMIVSGTVSAYDRAGRADVFLPKGAGSPAEMLERIRVLVMRKRGPKKMILPTPQPANFNIAASAAS